MKRIDQILVERQIVSSRNRAQSMIESGLIQVNGKKIEKCSLKFDDTENLEIFLLEEDLDVGRGAKKLRPLALKFSEKIKDQICLDVGSSTGGFTQVLLENMAKKVVAVDVGTDQLHASLRARPEVLSLENMHIQDFFTYFLDQGLPPFTVVVVDVSFISLLKIMPTLFKLVGSKSTIFLLYKPQFEVGKDFLKKGIVQMSHDKVKKMIDSFLASVELMASQQEATIQTLALEPCQLQGKDGNQEYFVVLEYLAHD